MKCLGFALGVLVACGSGSSSSTGTGSTGTGSGGAAASGAGGAGGAGSGKFICDAHTKASYCAEYPAGSTQAEVSSSCDGTLGMAPCPTDKSVGSCAFTAMGKTLVEVYYSDGPKAFNVATATVDCTTKLGTFTKA